MDVENFIRKKLKKDGIYFKILYVKLKTKIFFKQINFQPIYDNQGNKLIEIRSELPNNFPIWIIEDLRNNFNCSFYDSINLDNSFILFIIS